MGHDRTAIQRQFLKKEKVKQGIMAKSTWRKVAHVRKQRGYKKRGGVRQIFYVCMNIFHKDQKKVSGLLETGIEVVVCCQTEMLGTEF